VDRLRILVVEDNADTAATLATLLGLAGHEVRVAHDGPAALQAVQEFPLDVMLLDIGLPGMNGWQVVEQFRQRPAHQRPLVIAVTWYGQESDRRRSQEAGIALHLLKPVDPDDLLGLLSRFQRLLAQPPLPSRARVV
jgi:two-component system CheB/CheR fusion protein